VTDDDVTPLGGRVAGIVVDLRERVLKHVAASSNGTPC
jgi:hypothetical protein